MARPPRPKSDVSVTPKPKAPGEWSPRPIPTPGVGRSTADPVTPKLKELAARAQKASVVADAVGAVIRPDQVAAQAPAQLASLLTSTVPVEPQTLEAKRQRAEWRRSLVQSARERAASMPPGEDRTALLATASRFEDDTRAVDRMKLAKHVYDFAKNPSTPPPIGFEQLKTDAALTPFELKKSDLEPHGSDFRAAVYRSQLDPRGTPILVFRGTQTGDDWDNNFRQGSALVSDHYVRALRVGRSLSDATRSTGGFETAGHSLGGGMASAVSAKFKVRGDTFNAAGVSEATLARVGASRANGASLLNAYNVDGEILTALQNDGARTGPADGLRYLPIAGGVIDGLGGLREVTGQRLAPDALGRKRMIPAVDPPEYQGMGAMNPMKYLNRHYSPVVLAGFEQEKSLDSRTLGLAVRPPGPIR